MDGELNNNRFLGTRSKGTEN